MTNFPDDESVPPIEQGQLEGEAALTRWPTVIGVISLIYAIIGLCCALTITGSGFLSEFFMSMGGMKVQMPTLLKIMNGVSGLLLLIAGIMLISGAVGTLRRKRSGPSMLRKWAVYRLVLLVLGLAAAILTAPTQMQFQRSIHDAQQQMLKDRGSKVTIPTLTDQQLWMQLIISVAIFTVVFSVYPLFLGIYLSRRTITDEVAEWR